MKKEELHLVCSTMQTNAGIYIHIPFCASRCHYCNFATGGYESETAQRYVNALVQEIERTDVTGAMRSVDTIYLGGGTPTTLSIEQLERILAACRQHFDVAANTEITTEANPGTIDAEYFQGLRTIGFNRISFGVQSFDDGELKMIDRVHNADEAREAVLMARAAGFENISIDLIAGLPEQQMTTWQNNLRQAFALNTEHLSVYLLELYKDAPLLHRIERGELRAIDEELTVAMYYELVDAAANHGYQPYELSNWAKPGYASRHNLKYWTGALYGAFGVSAAGYDGHSRWSNTRNIHEYLQRIEKGESPIAERIPLDEEDKQSEAIFLKLRLQDGVNLRAHQAQFGVNIQERYHDELTRLRAAGLIELHHDQLKISRAGKVLANEVFQAFV